MTTQTSPVPLSTTNRSLALALVKRARRVYDAYEADVDHWYRYGDGRSVAAGGKGYTYPECPHGKSRWTDYDNICGWCEEGYGSFDYAREAAYAISEVRWALAQVEARTAWVLAKPEGPLTDEEWSALLAYAARPLTDLKRKAVTP